jgi:hypothetical protein
MLRRYNNKESPSLTLLVAELTFQFSPSLIQNGFLTPALAFTLRPGFSIVPFADLDMLLTDKSSIHTIAWFLLSAHEVLLQVVFSDVDYSPQTDAIMLPVPGRYSAGICTLCELSFG